MAIKSKIKGKKKKKIVRSKYCPRCGPGIFLMEADNRDYCGKCHYTEFKIKAAKK
jgi:small subunit ribosomal protein S27Ae